MAVTRDRFSPFSRRRRKLPTEENGYETLWCIAGLGRAGRGAGHERSRLGIRRRPWRGFRRWRAWFRWRWRLPWRRFWRRPYVGGPEHGHGRLWPWRLGPWWLGPWWLGPWWL